MDKYDSGRNMRKISGTR